MIICSEQAGNESAVSVSIIFSCVYHNIFLVHSSFAEHLNWPHFSAKLREHYTGSSGRNVSGEKSRERYVERQLTGMAWVIALWHCDYSPSDWLLSISTSVERQLLIVGGKELMRAPFLHKNLSPDENSWRRKRYLLQSVPIDKVHILL